MKRANDLSLRERVKAPAPKLFKKIGRIGLVLAGVGAAVLAAPIALPAAVITAAGYVATVGAVAKAVSMVTVDEELLNAE